VGLPKFCHHGYIFSIPPYPIEKSIEFIDGEDGETISYYQAKK
jgi:hypothetical protein